MQCNNLCFERKDLCIERKDVCIRRKGICLLCNSHFSAKNCYCLEDASLPSKELQHFLYSFLKTFISVKTQTGLGHATVPGGYR